MPHAYTEDQLVEQPAIGLFAELGWQTVSAMEETFGATGTLLRETKGEVVLVSRLRAALERLNPALPPEAITAAVDELTRDRSAMSLPAANREIYSLIKDGIRVSIAQPEDSPSSPALLPAGEGSRPHRLTISTVRAVAQQEGDLGLRWQNEVATPLFPSNTSCPAQVAGHPKAPSPLRFAVSVHDAFGGRRALRELAAVLIARRNKPRSKRPVHPGGDINLA